MKKLVNLAFILLLAIINTGCLSSWLSIGEEQSQCDKNTKRLGKCVGISDVMKHKYTYMNDYLKGVNE